MRGLKLDLYGVPVEIRAGDAAVVAGVTQRLPPGWRPTRQVPVRSYSVLRGRLYELWQDGRRHMRSRSLERVLDALEDDLHPYLAEHASRRIFVHAGVVGWRGKAILVPGRSFSGKSTLVAALVRAGAVYYSDEYAVLDGRGFVQPFPRRLMLRRPGGGPPPRRRAESLGGPAGTRPLPVGLVVVTRYRKGASWRPRCVSAGQAVLELLSHTVPARRRAQAALETLSRVASRARALKGVRGEADEVIHSLLKPGMQMSGPSASARAATPRAPTCP